MACLRSRIEHISFCIKHLRFLKVMNDLLSSPDVMTEIVWHNSTQRKKYCTWGGTPCNAANPVRFDSDKVIRAIGWQHVCALRNPIAFWPREVDHGIIPILWRYSLMWQCIDRQPRRQAVSYTRRQCPVPGQGAERRLRSSESWRASICSDNSEIKNIEIGQRWGRSNVTDTIQIILWGFPDSSFEKLS
jgi:hypothetical protein